MDSSSYILLELILGKAHKSSLSPPYLSLSLSLSQTSVRKLYSERGLKERQDEKIWVKMRGDGGGLHIGALAGLQAQFDLGGL